MCLLILLRANLLQKRSPRFDPHRSPPLDAPNTPRVKTTELGGEDASPDAFLDRKTEKKARRNTISSSIRQSLRPLILPSQTCYTSRNVLSTVVDSDSFDEMLSGDTTIKFFSTPHERTQDFVKVYDDGKASQPVFSPASTTHNDLGSLDLVSDHHSNDRSDESEHESEYSNCSSSVSKGSLD